MFLKILQRIKSGKFELSSLLQKIEKLWMEGQLSEYERDRLYEEARANADPKRSLLPIEKQLEELSRIVKDLQYRVNKLEGKEEEILPYKRPSSEWETYSKGDKILWKQRIKISNRDGVVWNPDDFPEAWDDYIEEKEEE